MNQKDCLFCKIALREIDADIVHETDNVLVFKDIHPKAPVHLLVIPKKHIATLNDATDADATLLGELQLIVRDVAKKLGVVGQGYKVAINVGKGGGQEVFHIHMHLLSGL